MTRILALALLSATLGGCIHRPDPCYDAYVRNRPANLNERVFESSTANWNHHYAHCKMFEAVINQPATRPSIDVYVRN